MGVVLLCLVLMVRGYALTPDAVLVKRGGWTKRIALEGLRTAEVHPGATAGSLRTWGIGGVFGFIGRFRNDRLGPYTAYVTDAAKTVVLAFENRTVVLSPDDPSAFVEEVQARTSG